MWDVDATPGRNPDDFLALTLLLGKLIHFEIRDFLNNNTRTAHNNRIQGVKQLAVLCVRY